MSTFDIDLTGLTGTIDYFKTLPDESARAASMAINQIASRSGMRTIQDEMYAQIQFPRGYLTGDRLGVTQYAKPTSLEAKITARKRATSLARFAAGQPLGSRGHAGVRVAVKAGSSTHLKDAWLVRLNKGASKDEDNYNIGLAVRLKPGQQLENKKSTHTSWLVPNAVALLYGPSVNQVFQDVREDVSGELADQLSAEFFRQLRRLTE